MCELHGCEQRAHAVNEVRVSGPGAEAPGPCRRERDVDPDEPVLGDVQRDPCADRVGDGDAGRDEQERAAARAVLGFARGKRPRLARARGVASEKEASLSEAAGAVVLAERLRERDLAVVGQRAVVVTDEDEPMPASSRSMTPARESSPAREQRYGVLELDGVLNDTVAGRRKLDELDVP